MPTSPAVATRRKKELIWKIPLHSIIGSFLGGSIVSVRIRPPRARTHKLGFGPILKVRGAGKESGLVPAHAEHVFHIYPEFPQARERVLKAFGRGPVVAAMVIDVYHSAV